MTRSNSGMVYAAPVGRPSYGPLLLLKCLLLQQWYGLSDLDLEEALSDRLSFRRFVGLAVADPVSDHQLSCHAPDAAPLGHPRRPFLVTKGTTPA